MKKTEKTSDSIRVTPTTKARFDRANAQFGAKAGETFTQDEGVNHLLDTLGELAQRLDAGYPYMTTNRELHDKLEAVLNSGDDPTIRAVVPNIEIFFERLRPASAHRKSGT